MSSIRSFRFRNCRRFSGDPRCNFFFSLFRCTRKGHSSHRPKTYWYMSWCKKLGLIYVYQNGPIYPRAILWWRLPDDYAELLLQNAPKMKYVLLEYLIVDQKFYFSSKVDIFFSHSSSQIGPGQNQSWPNREMARAKKKSTFIEKEKFWPTIWYSSKTYFILKTFCKRSSAQSSGKRHHVLVQTHIRPFGAPRTFCTNSHAPQRLK